MPGYYQTYDQTTREEINPNLLDLIWEYRNDCLIKNNKTPKSPYIYKLFEKYLDWYYDRDSISPFKRNQFSSRKTAWNSFIEYYEERVRELGKTDPKNMHHFDGSSKDVILGMRNGWEEKYGLPKSGPKGLKFGGTKRRKSKKRTRRKLK
jgi:hypothetical protein